MKTVQMLPYQQKPGKPYRPCNGMEGEVFFDHWCSQCARDRAMRDGDPVEECDDTQLCQIIADTFAYSEDDPRYPKEWVINDAGQPCCTAFIEAGQPVPEPHCEHTADLFGGAA